MQSIHNYCNILLRDIKSITHFTFHQLGAPMCEQLLTGFIARMQWASKLEVRRALKPGCMLELSQVFIQSAILLSPPLLLLVLWMEPRASHRWGKLSSTKPHSQPISQLVITITKYLKEATYKGKKVIFILFFSSHLWRFKVQGWAAPLIWLVVRAVCGEEVTEVRGRGRGPRLPSQSTPPGT